MFRLCIVLKAMLGVLRVFRGLRMFTFLMVFLDAWVACCV